MRIAEHAVVSFHYILRDDAGKVLDQSDADRPLVYIHGAGGIIPGLESALDGKTAGEKLSVHVQPEQAYGMRDESLLQVVPLSAFGEGPALELGQQFHADTGHGSMVISVTKIDGDQITVDGNHELAGIALNFDVEIVEVRAASKEELDHGHVHDEHCSHHQH